MVGAAHPQINTQGENKNIFFAFSDEEYYDEAMRKSSKLTRIWEAVTIGKYSKVPNVSIFIEEGLIVCGFCYRHDTEHFRNRETGKLSRRKKRVVITPGTVECPNCYGWLYWRRLDAKPDDTKELGRKIILEKEE
jgi:hypothetical protein